MLPAGTRLGPYEIQARIGAGGMGEVYRGWDTRLERPVALKVLPPSLTGSAPALERFRREAQAIAALSHPHICTIHDVGTSGDATQFIVMELLDGETLQHRLTGGPLEIAEVVEIGIALADALAAAHSQGIVHRDVKPANVFLTKHGPKILDFGIAKTIAPMPDDGAGVATMAVVTRPGVAVGTVAYMSPEQVRGQDLDARSDLFSLGAVLYEMATGRPAFDRPTEMSIAGAILHEPASPPRRVRPDIPPRLEALILKTLEKQRETRSQTASEVRAELQLVKHDPDAVRPSVTESATATSSATAGVVRTGVVRHPASVAFAATLVVLAVAAAAFYLMRPGTGAWNDANFRVRTLTTTGTADRAALSPDGAFVVYVNHDDQRESLWVAQTRTTGNVQIVPAEDGVTLLGATVTPDNSSVDFVKSRGPGSWEVWRVPSVGGTQRMIVRSADSMVGWSPDGRRMAFLRRDPEKGAVSVVTVDPDGQHEQVVTTRTQPLTYPLLTSRNGNGVQRPSWSPDGATIAVIGVENATVAAAQTPRSNRQPVMVDVAKRTERVIPLSGLLGSIAWLDAGNLLLTYNDQSTRTGTAQLWRMSYPSGTLTRVSNDASGYQGLSVAPGRGEAVSWFRSVRIGMWIGNGETYQGQEFTAATLGLGRSWPGQLRVTWLFDRLVYPTIAGGRESVILRGPNGATQELLADARSPIATPDGASIVYIDAREGGVWRADADGRNATKVLQERVTALAVTPDGQVVYNRVGSPELDLWIAPLTGLSPKRLVKGPATSPDVSPDGRWLVFGFRDDEHPTGTFAVCELPTCQTRRELPFSTGMQTQPRWMPKGHTLAYANANLTNLFAYNVDDNTTTQLTHFSGTTIGEFAWSRDGQHLAITRAQPMVEVVLLSGRR